MGFDYPLPLQIPAHIAQHAAAIRNHTQLRRPAPRKGLDRIMAARLNPQQSERARSAIKTTQLLKRLNCFALEQKGDQGEVVEIDPVRLKAIEILLRKSLPDLSTVTLEGSKDKPVAFSQVLIAPLTAPDESDD